MTIKNVKCNNNKKFGILKFANFFSQRLIRLWRTFFIFILHFARPASLGEAGEIYSLNFPIISAFPQYLVQNDAG